MIVVNHNDLSAFQQLLGVKFVMEPVKVAKVQDQRLQVEPNLLAGLGRWVRFSDLNPWPSEHWPCQWAML